MADPYIGEIRIFAGSFAPRSWTFCDGQLLSISQNTALFAIIGTTYGGDGETTFGLPDLRGRAAMHAGNGPGLTSRGIGQRGGAETATAAQIPSHSHTLQGVDADAQGTDPTGNRLATSNEDNYDDQGVPNVSMSSLATGSCNHQSHDNMQPYLTLNFIIALVGIFPPM